MKKTPKNNGIGGNSLAMIKRYFPKVESVEDADKPVIVEVTADDVSHAKVKDHETCALAIACKRTFKADGVIIGMTTSWIVRAKMATRFRNAGTISREITSFDRKAGFDAGYYLLTPASPSNKLGTQRAYDPVRNSKGGKGVRKFRHYTRNVRASLVGI
jgi:hypothetical protein